MTKQAKNVNGSFSDFAEHCIIFFWAIRKNARIWLKSLSFRERWSHLPSCTRSIIGDSSFPVVSTLGTTVTSAPYGLKSSAQSSWPHPPQTWILQDWTFMAERQEPQRFLRSLAPKNCQLSRSFDGLLYHIWLYLLLVSWYNTCQRWFTSKLENLRAGEILPYEGQQCLLQCLWLEHPVSTWIPPVKSTSLHHEVAFFFHHENVLGKSFEPWVPWLWPYRQPWTTPESSQRVSTVPCE